MRKLFQGISISIIVEIDGTDVKTDATYTYKTNKGKQRIILLEIDTDAVLARDQSEQLITTPEVMTSGDQAQVETSARMKDVLGMKIETKEKVVTTFK